MKGGGEEGLFWCARLCREGEGEGCWFMCWLMPAHKSGVWCVWLQKIYGDGRVEQLIRLAIPIFDMFELSPLGRGVLVLLLLLLYLLFCSLRVCMFRVASGNFNIYSILLSSPPPDGPSSGTESNLPVSHPTPGIQIAEYASIIVRQDNVCLRT